MAITYTGAGSSKVNKSIIMESQTDQDIREAYSGERLSPVIQQPNALRVAPYLPFLTDSFVKEYNTFAVMKRYRLVSLDEQGQVVLANGILRVKDQSASGEAGAVATYYDARPLIYSAYDYGSGSYGALNVANPPKNIDAFGGDLFASGDLDTEGTNSQASASTDPTGGGIAGRNFVGVSAARFPIGVICDKVLSGAGRLQFRDFDPQEAMTVLTGRTLLVTEQAVNRYNYGQATRNAVIYRNSKVGTGTTANNTSIVIGDMPIWVNQGDTDADVASANDMILPGDLVACDDAGNFIRWDVRVDDWADAAGNVETDGDPAVNITDLDLNAHYPVAALAAVVGRCQNREKVVASTALNLVRTYQNSTAVGGSGTGGIEMILTRGATMTSGELASIQKTMTPYQLPVGATADNALAWDAALAKFALLIHITL